MRVSLIEASPVFREGLKHILGVIKGVTVVEESETWQDFFRKTNLDCDVIILDGELEALLFFRAFGRLRRKGRPPYVLVLSRHCETHHAVQMLRAGADGYVEKSKSTDVIVEAIRKVSRGEKYVSSEVAENLPFHFDQFTPARLSDREYEVLYLYASGLRMSEIAVQLSLSVKTVSTYRSRLLEKLNLKSNAELMRYAFKKGVAS